MAGAAQPFSGLQEAVASLYGNAVQILRRDPVTGGDINRAYMLKLPVSFTAEGDDCCDYRLTKSF